MKSKTTYCNIASLPERVESLEKTVKSILPQVNYLFIALNNYKEAPKFLLNNPRIQYAITDNLFTDASKFMNTENYDGYVFTLDDDLQVPSDYVSYMIEGVEKYNSIVSLHGKTMKPKPVHSFYHGFEKAFMCLSQVNEDVRVDVCGTGIMCYHTDIFDISPQDCSIGKMADVWVAKKAKELNIDMWVLKHKSKYISHVVHPYCIYHDNHPERDRLATEVFNSF